MLRNVGRARHRGGLVVLNEVLSLNAQEFARTAPAVVPAVLLNEVLSLNAQEWPSFSAMPYAMRILNEVLSLNAQESAEAGEGPAREVSSMKS